jgi:hypothetical protein
MMATHLSSKDLKMDLAIYARSLRSDLEGVRKLLTAFEAGTLQAGTRRPSGEWEDVTERTIQLYRRLIVTYESTLGAVEARKAKAG